ncbi:DUF2157 domain-containing protein [Marinifilum caeruleilacunae]|uniref:DUF2157 domain-containing protein n=1 Tax=Marinifilum caeruleilacunae TaxID=2499076 RepID=A0ABX1WVD0_9BACT|nr:DUF2157 domain-containing protein [Marinifilum caeruleilacunae]NOU60070.1 DUF2157 domain-containing protein [Marinifilum caeruleilacunae]
MSIQKEIPKLVEAKVISQSTADDILTYYANQKQPTQNRLLSIFGTLGAIMVGLGIILIIAHNWDQFPRSIKATFAILPLVIGQFACGFTLLRKQTSQSWREASSAFLFFAIGSCISLISQIYNIPGQLGSFLFIWMILYLPIPFLMRSSVGSILFIVGSLFYALNIGYWEYPNTIPYWYILFIAASILFYLIQKKENPAGNSVAIHSWLIPLSITICLRAFSKNHEEIMFLAYMSLFGVFASIGKQVSFSQLTPASNGFKIIAWLGSIIVLLILSFDAVWIDIRRNSYEFPTLLQSTEVYATILLTTIALILAKINWTKSKAGFSESLFFVLLLIYITASHTSFAYILVNLLVFAFGIVTIVSGNREQNLGILNSGLVIITALIICRFFDTDLSFVLRGILFLSIGFGFFIANYQLLKKRKHHA